MLITYTNSIAVLQERKGMVLVCMGNAGKKINRKQIYLGGISIGVILIMKYIVPMVLPFLIAGFIIIPLYPSLIKVEKRLHIRRSVLAAGLLLLLALCMLIALWQLVLWLCSFAGSIVSHVDLFEESFCSFVQNCCREAEYRLGVNAVEMETLVLERVDILIENLEVNIIPKLMNESVTYVKIIGAAAGFLFLTFIASVLLAKDYEAMKETLRKVEGYRMAAAVYEKMTKSILHFMRAQLVILMIIASICILGLLVTGIDRAIPLGILTGFMDMLPFIGTGIVLLPIAFWQLLQGSVWKAAACVVLYIICVMARELLEPKLIGEKMGIFPIYILISIYAGLKLYGLSGVIFGPLSFILIKEIYQSMNFSQNAG